MDQHASSHLVLLPFAPLLFALYLHLIAQATRLSPPAMPGVTGTTKSTADTSLRHSKYYIDGADLVLRVANTLFRVHRFFLTRDSKHFEDKLPHSFGKPPKHSLDDDPLVLDDDVLEVDFERLLWVFYNPKYSIYNGSIDKWISILKLAHKWDFIEVKALAVRELQNLQIPPIQKVALYQTYSIDRNLLQPAFTALTTRDEPITIEEGREITLETALRLAKARELARALGSSGKKSGNPRSPVNVAGVELDALIKDVLLQSPLPSVPSHTPQPSIARGTAPDGGDTPQSTLAKWFDPFLNTPQGEVLASIVLCPADLLG
ncbi:hypothetical protein F5148DRAFT_325776 [Russula earlei]|uniref:Uncharacterized protein n=1 Tax=Russula earlei TaxID=71964 RepID=A0ACC0UIB2_9AGAM|nr:hypothetical protein F5148DRAFT_325776 [Russula earlei]